MFPCEPQISSHPDRTVGKRLATERSAACRSWSIRCGEVPLLRPCRGPCAEQVDVSRSSTAFISATSTVPVALWIGDHRPVADTCDIGMSPERVRSTSRPQAGPGTVTAGKRCGYMTRYGHGGFTGLLVGSVSQAALHHAACLVAIVAHGRGQPVVG